MIDIKSYKDKLERGLAEYMEIPVNQRSADAVKGMMEAWLVADKLSKCTCHEDTFTREDAEAWNTKMLNDDGTAGGHWTIEQTNAVAQSVGVKFDHITADGWNTTMNMMYSDYSGVANKYGVSTCDFYADLAKAFLFDRDGGAPESKLAAYYHCIVEG